MTAQSGKNRRYDVRPDGALGLSDRCKINRMLATFKLRIDPELLEVARVEARHADVSLSTYITSAVIARSAFDYARRGGEGVETLDRFQKAAMELVAREYFSEEGP